MDSTDQAWWLQDSEHKENEEHSLCTDSGNFDLNMNNTLIKKNPTYKIRKMDSSDRNRWLQEADLANHNEGSSSYSENISCSDSTKSNSTPSRSHSYSIRKMDSSDRNRWLQEAAEEDTINEIQNSCASSISNSESIKSNKLSSSIRNQYLPEEEDEESNSHSVLCDNISNLDSQSSNSLSNKNKTYRVRKMDSFDTPWWLNEEKNSCGSDESKLSSNKKSDYSLAKSPEIMASYGVRKMDSFDSPWWLSGDEAKQANSLSDKSVKNSCNGENVIESFPLSSENEENINLNEYQWWLNNGVDSQLEDVNGMSDVEETDNNYLDSNDLEPWNNDYPLGQKMDSMELNWWEEDKKNTDATSVSIDWSREGPELSNNQLKSTSTDSPLKKLPSVRKMDSYDSPSWLASEESESQSHEPKQTTSSGDAVSSGSKRVEELFDSSPDWWGEKSPSDDFVRTKRTSLRIKKIDNIVNEAPVEPITNNAPKELNLQNELDQLMLFIGGCRNIDELLGNEEPPPAAPTTPPDTDSGSISIFIFFCYL